MLGSNPSAAMWFQRDGGRLYSRSFLIFPANTKKTSRENQSDKSREFEGSALIYIKGSRRPSFLYSLFICRFYDFCLSR